MYSIVHSKDEIFHINRELYLLHVQLRQTLLNYEDKTFLCTWRLAFPVISKLAKANANGIFIIRKDLHKSWRLSFCHWEYLQSECISYE
jgi:hypothetical protein